MNQLIPFTPDLHWDDDDGLIEFGIRTTGRRSATDEVLSEITVQCDGDDQHESGPVEDRVQGESGDAETTVDRRDVSLQPADVLSSG